MAIVGLAGVVAVIDVAAAIGGEGQFLAPCGSGGAGPSARWRRRAGCPGRRCAGWRGCWPAARPGRRAPGRRAGSGRRSPASAIGMLPLDVVDPQALERPAGDRDIAVGRDPLGIDEVAQPVVAGDVVAAGDGLVGGDPERAGHAPIGVELEPCRCPRNSRGCRRRSSGVEVGRVGIGRSRRR